MKLKAVTAFAADRLNQLRTTCGVIASLQEACVSCHAAVAHILGLNSTAQVAIHSAQTHWQLLEASVAQ